MFVVFTLCCKIFGHRVADPEVESRRASSHITATPATKGRHGFLFKNAAGFGTSGAAINGQSGRRG